MNGGKNPGGNGPIPGTEPKGDIEGGRELGGNTNPELVDVRGGGSMGIPCGEIGYCGYCW
jgi:hypothetical protein